MSIYRKIIAVLVGIAITFSVIIVPVFAVIDLFEPFTKVLVVPFSDFVVDVLHAGDKIYDALTEIQRENFREALDFWPSFFGSDSSQSYSTYVSTLPTPEVSYEGELIVPCFHVQFFCSGSNSSCGHSIDVNDNLTFTANSYDKDKYFFDCNNDSVIFLTDFSGSVNIVWAFIPHAAGTYSNVWPAVSTGTAWKYPVTITDDQVGKVYVVGGTNSISVSRDSGSTVALSPCYMLYEAPPVDFEEDAQYSYSSRPAYLTQQIYNYNNSGNSTTNMVLALWMAAGI